MTLLTQNASSHRLLSRASDRPFGGPLKRSADIVIALLILVVTAPVLILIAWAIWSEDRGPVLFVQDRIGRAGRRFRCLKFRSMVVDAEARMEGLLRSDPEAASQWREKQKILDDPRVTRTGRWLRRCSLDELPQVVNVLRGDMSIVGPRPILPDQIEPYGPAFHRYCTARPGITGLWQVSGRNETSFRGRSELDQVYLAGWSLLTDFGLVLKTVAVVLQQRGAC